MFASGDDGSKHMAPPRADDDIEHLLKVGSGSISGSNNYVDSLTTSGSVSITKTNEAFVNKIPCLQTEECVAIFDEYANLSPKTYEDLTYDAGDDQSSRKTICHVTCICRCRSLRLDVLVFTIFTT